MSESAASELVSVFVEEFISEVLLSDVEVSEELSVSSASSEEVSESDSSGFSESSFFSEISGSFGFSCSSGCAQMMVPFTLTVSG